MIEVCRMGSNLQYFFLCFQRFILNLENSFKRVEVLLRYWVLGSSVASEERKNRVIVRERPWSLVWRFCGNEWRCSVQTSPVPTELLWSLPEVWGDSGPHVQWQILMQALSQVLVTLNKYFFLWRSCFTKQRLWRRKRAWTTVFNPKTTISFTCCILALVEFFN